MILFIIGLIIGLLIGLYIMAILVKNNEIINGDLIFENKKLKEIREYIENNEKEYGSLEDNEKIILEILDKENK